MSTRILTDKQFEDSCVIDTEQLDDALTDIIDKFNNIGPLADISSWCQKQVVWGYTPPRWDTTEPLAPNELPWLPSPPLGVTGINERLKSNDPAGVSMIYTTSPTIATGFCWQMSFWTEDAIVVTDLDIHMAIDSNYGIAYNNPYGPTTYSMTWGSARTPPSPIVTGDYIEDIIVSLTVDSPFNQQDPAEVALTLHKSMFSADSQNFNQDVASWETADMLPSLAASPYTDGLWIQAKEVNAPIPAKSRVRVNIVIPNWDGSAAESNWWREGDCIRPWARVRWNNTLTFLERKV